MNKFYATFFRFVLSMLTLLVSKSLLIVFLGWEGLGITSVALIIFYQNHVRFNSGVLTLLTNRLGDALLLLILGRGFFRISYVRG